MYFDHQERLKELTDERDDLQTVLDDAQESQRDADDPEEHREAVEEAQQALDAWDRENADELGTLEDLPRDAILILESEFEDYARELAEELNKRDAFDKWPFTCIDWEQAAHELRMDYTEIEVAGKTYLYRE